ncbi:hypothetical protein Dtox_3144 [Desulfofarcimen acetoxidans DSM 771]|uniref:Uncharacterized protein n=1 Tax=Desulfofarcimen acetoxidans (strain ATCC 49208 / DSM 771 / KCTC 5769 / VKM B-1644 / 5575) TaxID=485916 RepID=C8W4K3_DESAS|nr:hypothetical protein [Desulfofarcimen acetoxidans]ACV63889.1 hypothetical protein Dtox_3144 [Desulfofarcimen acetoxidans DSM 771]
MARFLIKTKSKLYNGVTEGVLFKNGQAVVEDEFIKNLLVVNYGYTIEIIEDDKKKAK